MSSLAEYYWAELAANFRAALRWAFWPKCDVCGVEPAYFEHFQIGDTLKKNWTMADAVPWSEVFKERAGEKPDDDLDLTDGGDGWYYVCWGCSCEPGHEGHGPVE
jgi:hypothetical protein